MTIDNIVTKIDLPGWFEIFAGGGLTAVILFSVGILFLAVPVIGLILGPAMMLTAGLVAITHVGLMFRHKHGYAGHCPHCGASVDAGEPGSVGECGDCQNKFVHRDNHLWEIEK